MPTSSPHMFITKTKITKFEGLVSDKVMHTPEDEFVQAKNQVMKGFFDLLGYNINSKADIIQNYMVDVDNCIDYAVLNKQGKPNMLVLCTEFKYILTEAHLVRLQHGFNKIASVILGVLTNGQVFQFYQINHKSNLMDHVPFLAIDFTEYIHKENAVVAILHKMKKKYLKEL